LFDQEVEGLVVVYLGRMAEIVFDFE